MFGVSHAQRSPCTMEACAKYESLFSEMVSLGSDLNVARDQLAITSKKDSRAYQSAQSRFKRSRTKMEARFQRTKSTQGRPSMGVLPDNCLDRAIILKTPSSRVTAL